MEYSMRDLVEICVSAIVCIGLLITNPILTNGIPRCAQKKVRSNKLIQLIMAFALSYTITNSKEEALIAVVVFVLLKRLIISQHPKRV